MKDDIIVAIGVGIALIVVYAISWIVTCGLIKFITICFGWQFTWKIATGIWVMLLLARWVFGGHKNKV